LPSVFQALINMNIESTQATDPAVLKYLFTHNLNKLYYGKRYMQDNLPHLIEIASFKALQLALEELQEDINKHITRLDEIYATAGVTPSDEECIPIKAIFKETFILEKKGIGRELLGDMDVMLYMQLIEHINITAYRTLRIVAKALKLTEIEQLLIESFDESIEDDRLFMMITNEYLRDQLPE
jgi:ferritin-like metal-binding protein YciE